MAIVAMTVMDNPRPVTILPMTEGTQVDGEDVKP